MDLFFGYPLGMTPIDSRKINWELFALNLPQF
jgi:hypothetical protein